MGRGIGWLLVRWAVVLGAGTLALALSLAGLRAAAVGADQATTAPEKQKDSSQKTPVNSKTKREALRYGGKNFDQWRLELETELKPEIRVDGLTAMAAFGANGYGAEAARVIVDVMKGYQLNTENHQDEKVVFAAFEAIRKIEKPAVPILWENLNSDNRRIRLFVIACVTNWYNPSEKKMDCEVQKHIPELLKAVKHEDAIVRQVVLSELEKIEDKPKECVSLFLDFLRDKKDDVRWEALQNLTGMGSEEPEVLSALSRVIKDSDGFHSWDALRMAAHYGARAKPVLPALLELLDKQLKGAQHFGCVELMDAFSAIGPEAKESLPGLRKLRQQMASNRDYDGRIEHRDLSYVQLLDQTIKKIEGK